MKRRAMLALLAAAAAGAWPRALAAQARARLGYLSGGRRADNEENTIRVLRDSLKDHGWRVGENLTVDERWADGDFASMPRLARELIAERPDILVSTGTTETRALHALTKTIPIVFMQLAVDPVSVGFVQRIARPGGNITGFMQWPHSLWGKRIELLTELLGRPPRRLAWIGNPGNAGSPNNWTDAREAAGRARKSAALACPPAGTAGPRMRIWRPCWGHQNDTAACGLTARSRPLPLAAPDAKYQRPSPSTSLQISTRDEGRPRSSAVARVMVCGAGTASPMAASSQRRNKVTGSSGAACGSNSGIPAGNTRCERSSSRRTAGSAAIGSFPFASRSGPDTPPACHAPLAPCHIAQFAPAGLVGPSLGGFTRAGLPW